MCRRGSAAAVWVGVPDTGPTPALAIIVRVGFCDSDSDLVCDTNSDTNRCIAGCVSISHCDIDTVSKPDANADADPDADTICHADCKLCSRSQRRSDPGAVPVTSFDGLDC